MKHDNITDIPTYLRAYASRELGERILEVFSALACRRRPAVTPDPQAASEPFHAQTLAIMGLVRRWQQARAGAVIAECGTARPSSRLAPCTRTPRGEPFTALVMAPGHVSGKWCRETLLTPPSRAGVHDRRSAEHHEPGLTTASMK